MEKKNGPSDKNHFTKSHHPFRTFCIWVGLKSWQRFHFDSMKITHIILHLFAIHSAKNPHVGLTSYNTELTADLRVIFLTVSRNVLMSLSKYFMTNTHKTLMLLYALAYVSQENSLGTSVTMLKKPQPCWRRK